MADLQSSLGQGYRIYIDQLEFDWSVGVYSHERTQRQKLVVSIELEARLAGDWEQDKYENVVCYDKIRHAIKELSESGHIDLLETLAWRIGGICLQQPAVDRVNVRVDKPGAFDNDPCGAGSRAGVAIERCRETG